MTAIVSIAGDSLVVTMDRVESILSLHHVVNVPLSNVVNATRASEASDALPHWYGKLEGTQVPGYFAGLFTHDDGTVFCDFRSHDLENAIVIALRNDRYTSLVVNVDDANSTIAAIKATAGLT